MAPRRRFGLALLAGAGLAAWRPWGQWDAALVDGQPAIAPPANTALKRRDVLLSGLTNPVPASGALFSGLVGMPEWADEFRAMPAGFFSSEKPPVLSWLPIPEPPVDTFGESLVFPEWMSGTWQVQYQKKDVRFPLGWGVLSPEVPGVGMASVIRLPNIGMEPRAEWRFEAVPGGARVDWAATLPSVLESFWSDAKSMARPTKNADAGWAIQYNSPVAGQPASLMMRSEVEPSFGRMNRTVLVSWLGGEVWRDNEHQGFLSREWLRQKDELLAPDGVYDYKVLTAMRLGEDGESARGMLRVEAFLQPLDQGYIEAKGQAVAVYDYNVRLARKAA